MADETETTEAAGATTTEAVQPSGFSPEELAQFRAENQALREQLAEMRGAVDALKSQPHTTVAAAPSEAVISDEEIDEAVSEGKGAASKFRTLVDQAVKRATSRLKAEEIDPLRTYGTGALKELASSSIKGNKYYKDYHKEIEAVAAQVPPENLGNPQTWQLIYNNVVGAHADEIERKAAEAAVRQARDQGGDPALPGGRSKAEDTAPPAPKVRDYGGQEAEQALRYKGCDEDEMVKRMRIPGVTTWAEYVAMGERLEQENG